MLLVQAIVLNFSSLLAREISELGQPLYLKQEPTGYYNTSGQWVNSAALLGRMNLGLKLASGKVPRIGKPSLRDGGLESLARSLGVSTISPETRASIEKALAQPATEYKDLGKSELTSGLLLGSPEFQRR